MKSNGFFVVPIFFYVRFLLLYTECRSEKVPKLVAELVKELQRKMSQKVGIVEEQTSHEKFSRGLFAQVVQLPLAMLLVIRLHSFFEKLPLFLVIGHGIGSLPGRHLAYTLVQVTQALRNTCIPVGELL